MKSIVHKVTFKKCDKDYRTYVTCYAENGEAWELRGYGETEKASEEQAMERYNEDFEYWDMYGMPLNWPKR